MFMPRKEQNYEIVACFVNFYNSIVLIEKRNNKKREQKKGMAVFF